MDKKTLYISGGVLTTGVVATGILLIRRHNKRKRGLLPPSGSSFLSTNSNELPTNFQNWNGGNTYMSNAPKGIRNNNIAILASFERVCLNGDICPLSTRGLNDLARHSIALRAGQAQLITKFHRRINKGHGNIIPVAHPRQCHVR